MNALGMHIPTQTGQATVNDLDVSATRLFTNRMKLGEFNPDSTVPWLTQAQSRVKSYGVYPWVSSAANNAETETPSRLALARKAGDASLVLLKNATITRKDGSIGKLLPLAVPKTGNFKVLVLGYYANNPELLPGRLLGDPERGRAGQRGDRRTRASSPRSRRSTRSAQVDYMRGFTDTGTNAEQLLRDDRSGGGVGGGGYDYVIVYAGMDSSASAGTTGTEDRDRTSLALPGQQGQLISQVDAANPNTVARDGDDRPAGRDRRSSRRTPAILWSSYNGMRKGESLADVLLGDYNPSGRTPETWYQIGRPASRAIYSYALRPAGPNGRTYMYYNGPVSYPFGYGLSYTTFDFSNLQISNAQADRRRHDQGERRRDEHGLARRQRDRRRCTSNTPNADPSLQRPIKRLEGFQKVFLAAGQTKTVTLPIKIADLAFYNEADKRFEVDHGAYGIQISTSSADSDIQPQDTINVNGHADAEAERPHRPAADRRAPTPRAASRSASCSPRASRSTRA